MEPNLLKDHDLVIRIDTKLDQIIEQTTKTNGRVSSLENWRNYISGGLALIVIIGLPLLWMLIQDVKKNGLDIQFLLGNH